MLSELKEWLVYLEPIAMSALAGATAGAFGINVFIATFVGFIVGTFLLLVLAIANTAPENGPSE